MNIKDRVTHITDGMMLLPLFIGASCRTFAPTAPNYFRGFTQGLMTGLIPVLAVWFFCIGASVQLSTTTTVLLKVRFAVAGQDLGYVGDRLHRFPIYSA